MLSEREHLVRESWARIVQRNAEAARLFYTRLFELDPSARELFAGIEMDAQGAKFLKMLGMIVNALEQPPELVSSVATLGRRHTGYRVAHTQYDTVGAALLWMLERMLGDAFTTEVREAWSEAYALIAAVMSRAGSTRTAAFTAETAVPPGVGGR